MDCILNNKLWRFFSGWNCKFYGFATNSSLSPSDLLSIAGLLKIWSTNVWFKVLSVMHTGGVWGCPFSHPSDRICPLLSELTSSQSPPFPVSRPEAASLPLCPSPLYVPWAAISSGSEPQTTWLFSIFQMEGHFPLRFPASVCCSVSSGCLSLDFLLSGTQGLRIRKRYVWVFALRNLFSSALVLLSQLHF